MGKDAQMGDAVVAMVFVAIVMSIAFTIVILIIVNVNLPIITLPEMVDVVHLMEKPAHLENVAVHLAFAVKMINLVLYFVILIMVIVILL